MGRIVAWGAAARALKREVYTLYYACRDPRVPWYAKAVAGVVVAYALSPIDLIPDFIPVLGYLDDLVLVPLGVALVLRLIPADVLADCRRRAEQTKARLRNWVAAGMIVLIWITIAAALAYYLFFSAPDPSRER
jgi:uncharacterized membrane protein YkvA (DUF1232 family)